MDENKIKELREKILFGIDLAYKKLIKKKSEEGGVLIYSEDGKIIKIKAIDLIKRELD